MKKDGSYKYFLYKITNVWVYLKAVPTFVIFFAAIRMVSWDTVQAIGADEVRLGLNQKITSVGH